MVVFQFFSVLFILQIANSTNENYKVISKLPQSPLMKYYSYSSVMILHFYIPSDTTEASFKFRAKDESTSIFVSKCDPRNVSIYMKLGSYPVINPDGIPFPKTFLNISRPEIHELILKTDLKPYYINISSPQAGDWFAISFVSWTDPNKDRIEQQGLSSKCEAYLNSELSVIQKTNIQSISSNTKIEFPLKQNQYEIYKFYVPEDIDHILIQIEILIPCKNEQNIFVYVQSGSIPNENKFQEKLSVNGNEEGKKYFYFWPEEENWQYVNISFHVKINESEIKDYAKIGLKLKYISGLEQDVTVIPNVTEKRINLLKTSVQKILSVKNTSLHYLSYQEYNLMRITSSENFMFEYDFRPNQNGSIPLFINITNKKMTVLKFYIHEIIDIGGTLSLGVAIKPNLKPSSHTEKHTIVACLRLNSREIPTYPSFCTFNNISTKAPIILNSSLAGTLKFLHLPFPDPGTYYLSIRAFYDDCIPCNCSKECQDDFQQCMLNCEANCTNDCSSCVGDCENQVSVDDFCGNCNCDGRCEMGNDTVKNTSVIFSISSQPCIAGSCGKKGSCNHYMAGGFIFSSCHCKGGYRGWDCSDNSQAMSNSHILLTILLLTLSNALFIPSIYFAYKRNYYTEAITYFCTMFASTFYHACDSKENQYGFCLFPLNVLQFCDFYCGLLTIWVTLVAMSYTNNRVTSICHVAGAIILAFSVTYNKHALWVFILPAVFGILLIGVNWGLQCRRTKKLFPAKKYLKVYMPIGAALVFMGLIGYAFLETKENYKIVHSLWHIVMAISVIFLLPNHKVFVPKN